jgi:hypothetical protein
MEQPHTVQSQQELRAAGSAAAIAAVTQRQGVSRKASGSTGPGAHGSARRGGERGMCPRSITGDAEPRRHQSKDCAGRTAGKPGSAPPPRIASTHEVILADGKRIIAERGSHSVACVDAQQVLQGADGQTRTAPQDISTLTPPRTPRTPGPAPPPRRARCSLSHTTRALLPIRERAETGARHPSL